MCLISAITVAASAPPLWNHTVMPTTDWRAQIPEFLQNSLKVDLKFLCLQSTDNFFYNISSKGHVCGGKSEAYFYLHTPSSNLEVTGCGRTLLLLFFFFPSLTIYITDTAVSSGPKLAFPTSVDYREDLLWVLINQKCVCETEREREKERMEAGVCDGVPECVCVYVCEANLHIHPMVCLTCFFSSLC